MEFVKPVASILKISSDKSLLEQVRRGYKEDSWCSNLASASCGMKNVEEHDGLWFVNGRLIIPHVGNLRETLFRLAHDVLSHFGFDKSYGILKTAYYWPNMCRDLEEGYVPSCAHCQRNKASTKRPAGPLHPLPIPENWGDSVAIDFIGPLPVDEGYDSIITFTDRLGSDVQIIPAHTNITAEQLAVIFFDKWYCENGLPLEIVSDRDKLFVSKFWSSLHKLTGTKLKMSSAYHPQTDGASERMNKTVNQCLRFHVTRNQKGWVRALPRIRFGIMNTTNKSLGFSPFQLKIGRSPRIMPPLTVEPESLESPVEERAAQLVRMLVLDVASAKDNLLLAKISQASQANKDRGPELVLPVGAQVCVSTKNRRRNYRAKGHHRAAKFMPRFDGPYTVIASHPETSTYTVDMPNSPLTFPTFHASQLRPFIENDDEQFPSRQLTKPGFIVTNEVVEEHLVECIVDSRRRGKGKQYLVRFVGYGPEDDRWISRRDLEQNEALTTWLAENPEDG